MKQSYSGKKIECQIINEKKKESSIENDATMFFQHGLGRMRLSFWMTSSHHVSNIPQKQIVNPEGN